MRRVVADDRTIRIVRAIARAAARRWPRFADEFESAALLSLVEAAADYDPGKGVDPDTYVRMHARWSIFDAINKESPLGYRGEAKRGEEFPSTINEGDDELSQWLTDLAVSKEEPVGWELEYEDEVRSLMRESAGPNARAACRIFLEAGVGMEAVARELGVGITRAYEVMNHTLEMAATSARMRAS